jgi:WD40 repeat protein
MRLSTSIAVLLAALSVSTPAAQDKPAPPPDRPIRTVGTRMVVHAVAFSPDGATILAWDSDGFARWNPETGKTLDRQPVFAKACGGKRGPLLPRSDDGRTVAANCAGKLVFFDMQTGESRGESKFDAKQTPVLYTQSPDGSLTASVVAGETGAIHVVDTKTGEQRALIQNEQEVQQMTFSASGRLLAAGAVGGVRLWQLPEGQLLRTVPGGTYHALSPDGQSLAMERGRDVVIVDVASGAVKQTVTATVSQLRFSGDGRVLAGWNNQRLTVWNTATAKVLLTLGASQLLTLALAPDATHLAAVAMDLSGGGAQTTLGVWKIPQ